jgi:hypothetical protein
VGPVLQTAFKGGRKRETGLFSLMYRCGYFDVRFTGYGKLSNSYFEKPTAIFTCFNSNRSLFFYKNRLAQDAEQEHNCPVFIVRVLLAVS